MQGRGGEGVLPVLRAPDNAADAVPPEQIPGRYVYGVLIFRSFPNSSLGTVLLEAPASCVTALNFPIVREWNVFSLLS